MAAWVPPNMQVDFKSLLSAMDQMWVRYMLVQVIYGSCIAAGSFLIFILLGVPAPLPLAIVSGLLSIVPIIGGLLASFVIAIICLMLGSTKFTEYLKCPIRFNCAGTSGAGHPGCLFLASVSPSPEKW